MMGELSLLRCLFTSDVAKLIQYAETMGYQVSLNEVMRSKAQADANAASGAGISNSLHLVGLAADLNLYINGVYQESSEAHRILGDYWKSLSPINRWGGDFHGKDLKPKPDGNHYSKTYQGRQ